MTRVALLQNRVILGGRLSVILSIVERLNGRGVVPDLVSCGLPAESVIRDRYGRMPRFRVRRLGAPPLPTDLDIAQFNRRVSRRLEGYDLVINTSNSLAGLRQDLAPVLHWVFFPRKRRAEAAAGIHMPERRPAPLSARYLTRALRRRLYREERIAPQTRVVAISEFVRAAVLADFAVPEERLAVVYPPVEVVPPATGNRRERVVTLGRFQPYKRQLEQLEVARRVPELEFAIAGFITSRRYFERCRWLRRRRRIDNAGLIAGASFAEVRQLLSTSRFFLHSVVNEPFGLTTVEAIHAGCVPVVHDSGGQREVVSDATLRFSTPEQAVALLSGLAGCGRLEEINRELRMRAAELFSPAAFDRRLDALLDRLL